VYRPITGIREAMQRVAEGNLSARAPLARHDELGSVAEGLNAMLGQMQHFNTVLQDRVDAATEALRARNAELVESYQRLFALQEALSRADQLAAIGQTAASVAHQVGTPLNLISGYVQMIREEQGSDSLTGQRLKTVEDQITKVTSALRTMIDLTRRPSPRELTDPVELVRRTCEVARPKLERANVRLDVRLPSEAPTIEADPIQLELTLLNLVANALDAMPSGGTLTISLSGHVRGSRKADTNRIRIEVADTGTGIPPALLPRIFDPWVTTKPAGRGSGLGLSIANSVITAHGGTITVHSEVGQGTVFTIELPIAVPQELTADR